MYNKFILSALFFILSVNIILTPVFAEIAFESGPLQEKPLDEREKEDEDIKEVWMYAIILVIIFIIIRLLFKVIKKRMNPKKD